VVSNVVTKPELMPAPARWMLASITALRALIKR
jgi:hypothetical protein